jgi:transposase
MKRGRPKLKLVLDETTAKAVRERFRQSHDARDKERLQAVRLAATGAYTYEEIGQAIGRAKSTVQRWLDRLKAGGPDTLLEVRAKSGRPSPFQEAKIQRALAEGLRQGRWLTAGQLAAWLKEQHGITRSARSLYYWLGKCGGVLKVPRPVHTKKNAAEAAAFEAHLYESLCALPLPAGRPVRVWMADESRYGLHSFTRRCWSLSGVRVVKPSQQKYQWGYVYGALEVVSGAAEFRFMPSVNLDFSRDFLQQIAERDPEAEHVVIWDQAGFHQRPGAKTLPERIHVLPLPPYSPELNPVEKLWDVIKDAVANRVYTALGRIEGALTEALRPFWESSERTLRLVGTGWLHTQANAS